MKLKRFNEDVSYDKPNISQKNKNYVKTELEILLQNLSTTKLLLQGELNSLKVYNDLDEEGQRHFLQQMDKLNRALYKFKKDYIGN